MKPKLHHGFLATCIFSTSLASLHAATEVILNDHHAQVVAKNQDSFRLSKKIVLSNGLIKNKYIQYHQGIPVLNALVTSSETQGIQSHWQGSYFENIAEDLPSVAASLSKDRALSIAKNSFQVDKKDVISHEKADLYIRINEKSKAELVYLVSFNVEGRQRLHRPFFFINALNGEILKSWEGLNSSQKAEGPGGNEKTGRYYYDLNSGLGFLTVSDTCTMSNAVVETYDMNHQTSGGTLFQFTCPTNSHQFINGAYSPLNDAHYIGTMIFKMYKNWYSVQPLAGKLQVFVHYGVNQVTGHWDGSKMIFGDGDANFYPLTVADVMGHELGHAITEDNSALIYQGQSGGINEAFSDMAGEATEAFINEKTGKENDWLVGGNVVKEKDKALRYFANPKLDGRSISHASEYYQGLDVHYSSGVFNKAFYLLATNPNWGIKRAFHAFLVANQVYWTAESTFNSAACGVVKACADLNFNAQDVKAAFGAVGVNANCGKSQRGR